MAKVKRPTCKYGSKCYRKNRDHLEKFSHGDDRLDEDDRKNQLDTSPGSSLENLVDTGDDTDDDHDDRKRKINTPHESKKLDVDEAKQSKTNQKRKIGTFFEVVSKKKHGDASLSSTGTSAARISKDESSVDDQGVEDFIKEKFLVEMPKDFYEFWKFAKQINSDSPLDALRPVELQLVGPFDVLAGRHKSAGGQVNWLLHWRYYYDPPEFMTVLRGCDDTLFHIGYFRDSPDQFPSFVASNEARQSCEISTCGQNLFAALDVYLDKRIKSSDSSPEAAKLKRRLREFCGGGGWNLERTTAAMTARWKTTNCKLFHGAGMVVPVDDNDVGYREVPVSHGALKKMLRAIENASEERRGEAFEPLMEIITYIQFANDECDYGEGLELGLQLFSFGSPLFHRTLLNLLPLAYQLLKRDAYKSIIEAHIANRKKGSSLSQIE